MLSVFNSLPGIYVYKDDNPMKILDVLTGKVTVVIGTSPDGPSGAFLVTDTSVAEATFDPTYSKQGTLLQGMYEAIDNGANNVILFRIGQSPAALDFVNGRTILTDLASSSAGDKYKLYYTNDHNSTGVEVIRVYDAATGSIVYDSYAGINTAGIVVYGEQYLDADTKSITIGADVATWSTSPTFSALRDFTQSAYSISASISVNPVGSGKTFTTASDAFKAGQLIQIDAADNTDDGYYEVSYVTETSGTYTVVLSKKVSYSNGVVSEVTWTGFNASGTGDSAVIKAKYIDANTGLSLGLNDLFAAYAKAYWELEAADVDVVIPSGVNFNEANVVDNEGQFRADQVGYSAPIESDYLGKVYEFQHDGTLFFAFKNSFTDADDVTADELPTPYELGIDGFAAKAWLEGTHQFDTAIVCASATDVTNAADDIYYNEANFGHQLAMFCHNLSTNHTEAKGVIGMKIPTNFSKAGISNWLGYAPTKTTSGTIAISGKGLLGYKYMAGSIGVVEGLFATSNGYPDATPIKDRNNNNVDIGKYLDVISNGLKIVSTYKGGSAGYASNGASVYAGYSASLNDNKPLTNQKLKKANSLLFKLSKADQDALVAAKYVVYGTSTDGYVKIIDAPTSALSTSYYSRRLTANIVSHLLKGIRSIAEPYIGGISSFQVLSSLEDEINNYLADKQNPQDQYIVGGLAKLVQTADMKVKGEAALQLQLYVPGELRRILVYTMVGN